MKKVLTGSLLFLFFFLFSSFAFANDSAFAPEEIVIKFSSGASINQIGKINQKFGAEIKEKLLTPSVFVLKVPAGKEEFLAKLFKSFPIVEYAEPNFEYKALLVPNDQYFSSQWGLTKIQSVLAWDIATGSSQVKIAIVDTGIDKDHQDLASKVDARINFSSSRTDDDLYGHGTHVAGIAAAITNNGIGVAGLGYDSHLLSVKVLNDSGSGYISWITNGIIWAADNGAKVINLSLGGSSPSQTLADAINYAWNKGAVVACAAGNNGNSTPMYPAYYQNCLAVAATDQNDQKTSWSNWGSWVDVAAPGVNIFSTLPNHKAKMTSTKNYGNASGTSMATPFVSGLAGLLFGENSNLTSEQVRNMIEESTDKISGTGTYWSYGRINAYKAVMAFYPQISPEPTTEPTLTLTPTSTPQPTFTPTPAPPTPTPTLIVPTSTPMPINIPTPEVPSLTPTPKLSPTATPIPWYCKRWPQLCN